MRKGKLSGNWSLLKILHKFIWMVIYFEKKFGK